MNSKINWFGFAGSIAILGLIIVSTYVPWWQLAVGEELILADISPINTKFNFVGNHFSIPLIFALNIVSIISLTAAGIVMLIYSIKPNQKYSKRNHHRET